MSQSIGLAVVVSAQTDPLAKGLRGAEGMIAKFDKAAGSGGGSVTFNQIANSLKDVRAEASRTEGVLGRVRRYALAGAVTGGIATGLSGGLDLAGGLTGAVGESIKLAAEFEKTQGAFEVMLGSAEKARDVIGDIRRFGAESPFNFAGLTDTAKQLAAYGIAGDQLVPTLKMLGEAATGDQEKLNRLAYAYGQVKSAGRLYGTELRQFTETGLPINEALAGVLKNPDGTKVAESGVKALVEEGKVGFPDLVRAFKSLTQEGGKFYGMTDKYAKTFAGSMERVKDSVAVLQQEFGQALIEELGLKDGAKDIEAFTDRLRAGINDLRPWVKTVGELGRGVIQVGYEFGKAGVQLAGGWVDQLATKIPELGRVAEIISGIGKDGQGFRIDPARARELGVALAEATEGLFVNVAQMGRNFRTEVVDPIVAAAREIKGIADYLREFGRTTSDIRQAVTSKENMFTGFATPAGTIDWSKGKNQLLAGPIQQTDPLLAARQNEESRMRRAMDEFARLDKIVKNPDWIKADKLAELTTARDQAAADLDASRRRLAELGRTGLDASHGVKAAAAALADLDATLALGAKAGLRPDEIGPIQRERAAAAAALEVAMRPPLTSPGYADWMSDPKRGDDFHAARAARFAIAGGASWFEPGPTEAAPMPRAATLEAAPVPRDFVPLAAGAAVLGGSFGNLAEQANKAAAGLKNVDNGVRVPDGPPQYLVDQAAQFKKQFADPLRVLDQFKGDLDKMRSFGLIDENTAARAFDERLKGLGTLDREIRLPAAMEFGSQAAAATLTAQQGATSVPALLQAIAETNRQELEVAREQLRQYEQTARPVVVPLAR